jgi:hypothetical protein
MSLPDVLTCLAPHTYELVAPGAQPPARCDPKAKLRGAIAGPSGEFVR